jgi:hypothetical protein
MEEMGKVQEVVVVFGFGIITGCFKSIIKRIRFFLLMQTEDKPVKIN